MTTLEEVQMKARRRVTAADVARSLGISRATVGFVLNDTPGQTISEPTRARVLAEAERLGYRPHRAAKALASGRSHIVLLVLPDWPMEHSMQSHLDQASRVLDEAGYSLVTTTSRSDRKTKPLWEVLDPDVAVSLVPWSKKDLASLARVGVRTVIHDPGSTQNESLQHDDETCRRLRFDDGPRLQVEHLRDRGRIRLAYVSLDDPRLVDLTSAREERARQTVEEIGGVELIDSASIDLASPGRIEYLLSRWIASGVDGVVAYNDTVAAAVVGAAHRIGLAVPDDLAVVGHDDTPLASLFVPSLSSVHVDYSGLGRFLAELALREAGEGSGPVREPEAVIYLISRASS